MKKRIHVCNICGLPGFVTFTEIDPETGTRVEKSHEVPCLGHHGIHPSLWNKSPCTPKQTEPIWLPGYDDYQKLKVQQRKNSKKKGKRK